MHKTFILWINTLLCKNWYFIMWRISVGFLICGSTISYHKTWTLKETFQTGLNSFCWHIYQNKQSDSYIVLIIWCEILQYLKMFQSLVIVFIGSCETKLHDEKLFIGFIIYFARVIRVLDVKPYLITILSSLSTPFE